MVVSDERGSSLARRHGATVEMTKQEHFKQRVRARMATTGERYAAARRALLDRAGPDRGRTWFSDPEMSDESVRAATGRGWDEWCDVIDAWSGHTDGHAAVAAHVHAEYEVTHWWAQAVTGGWERITGRRLPNQMSDGTFTASRSRTLRIDGARLRAELLDADGRSDLFGGVDGTLRSKPTSKAVRVALGPGTALFAIEPLADGRTKVTVSHERLPTLDALDEWKFFWQEWLDALDE